MKYATVLKTVSILLRIIGLYLYFLVLVFTYNFMNNVLVQLLGFLLNNVFSLMCSIHKGFSPRQGISSQISDHTERLLLEERNPPPVPQESLYKAPPFDEVDIEALAHAVELTRQGAVDSLMFSKGNLFKAFQAHF
ncbi:hypothetical protein GIB67_039081 [Kingdonia uniflora]|uniref:Uncharacterized protein n=1 Tax=Kingdonia uniflora TaxID=39325 RepID=A0A7J7LL92_9MAGN|nr:hypothetical protein GIB67_039081 [Kingdonia uniflora]